MANIIKIPQVGKSESAVSYLRVPVIEGMVLPIWLFNHDFMGDSILNNDVEPRG